MKFLDKIIKNAEKKAEKNSEKKNLETLQKTWKLLKNTTGAGDNAVFCAKIDLHKKDYESLFFFDLQTCKKTVLDTAITYIIKSMNVLPTGQDMEAVITEVKTCLEKTFADKTHLFENKTYVFVDIPNNIMGIICILESNTYKILSKFKFS